MLLDKPEQTPHKPVIIQIDKVNGHLMIGKLIHRVCSTKLSNSTAILLLVIDVFLSGLVIAKVACKSVSFTLFPSPSPYLYLTLIV